MRVGHLSREMGSSRVDMTGKNDKGITGVLHIDRQYCPTASLSPLFPTRPHSSAPQLPSLYPRAPILSAGVSFQEGGTVAATKRSR